MPTEGRSSGRGGPRVDEQDATLDGRDGEDLASHYEAMRAVAVGEGVSRAGLGAALLTSKGMPAWMRSWRACTPAAPSPGAPAQRAPASELVGVLAAMALACA